MKKLSEDLKSFTNGTNFRDILKVLILSPGFSSIILIRTQGFFYDRKLILISYFIRRLNLQLHGIDVMPGAQIGGGLRIEHPVGIVIGAGCILGTGCTIMQGVTLGVRNVLREKNDHAYPKVGNNVVIGANSVILGGIEIGDSVSIGANCSILQSCKPGMNVRTISTPLAGLNE
jgi:serine O-acetyltransferase